MNLDWDKLRVFHTVAEAGSLTHAAYEMNISQSAISRQISTLEHSLGVSLFHRHARGLILTEQGELLLDSTRDIYRKLTMIESQISDSQSEAIGPLKITVAGFLGMTWFAPTISEFIDKYPNLKLTFILDNKIYDLGMRQADAAIRLFEPQNPDLIKRKIATINFRMYASKAYAEKYGTPKSASDLKNHTLLGYPEEIAYPHPYTDWIFEYAGVNKIMDKNVVLINSMLAIKQAVQYGAGIACLPHFMVDQDDENMVCIMPDVIPPSIDVFFVYPEERRNARRIEIFRDFLLSKLDSLQI